ncbi:colanic acid biosynthesis protein [uncultured Blautia sp.]|nr:colanic acid biosynthesis protein [uncultured Blautia sp.]
MLERLGCLMNILIFGANWYNRGDEAALRAMLDEIKEQLPEAQLKIHFNQKVDKIPYSNVEIISSFTRPMGRNFLKKIPYLLSLKLGGKFNFMKGEQKSGFNSFMRAVKWANYAIYSPGGPSIGEHYRQFHLVDMMYLLMRNNVPFSIFAPSVGPFSTLKKYISHVFSYAEVICFREEISNGYYEELNPQKKAIVTLDSAFQHPINVKENEKTYLEYKELRNYIESHQKVIGITVTDLKWHRDYRDSDISTKIRESFTKIVNTLSQEGYGIVFVPQCFGASNDADYMRSFASKNCFVMSDQYDCYFQQYVISKMYAIIGMRYHSNIFSAKMGTPFISIAYEQKMTGFMKKANLEKYCLPISDLSAKVICDKFSQLVDDYDSYKQMLVQEKNQFALESHKTTDLIIESIHNSCCKGES